MSQEIVQFGCMRCNKTKRTAAFDEAAEKIMLQAFDAAFFMISKEGEQHGITVSPALKEKFYRWGVKASILPPSAALAEKVNEVRRANRGK